MVSGTGQMGWRADTSRVVPAGAEWHAAYLSAPQSWRASLGADATTPWTINLTEGKRSITLGTVNLEAQDYGVSGMLKVGGETKFLPLKINGINSNWPCAVWTPRGAAYSMAGFTHADPLPGAQSGPPSSPILVSLKGPVTPRWTVLLTPRSMPATL